MTTLSLYMHRNSRCQFTYTNWRGEIAKRHVEVGSVRWGSTEWHPDPGFILNAFDLDKKEWRDFAMKDIQQMERLP